MKYTIKKILALFTAVSLSAALSCCAKVEDSIPDSYYLTDNISETTETTTEIPVSYDTSAHKVSTEETAEESTVQDTAASLTESFTETAVLTEQESEAPLSETAVPEISRVTLPAERPVETESEGFVPGTLPPQTEATEKPAPSVTIVTIPTLSTSENTAVLSDDTQPVTEITSETYPSYYPENSYYAQNFDRQKGMWISYLEYDRIMKNSDEEQFTSALCTCFDNIAALGCNTVYFQVRVYGDAYYRSSLFPKGDRLTGDYDPLAIAVRAAHDRGLSIHAWINPMRLMTDAQMKEIPTSYKIGEWYNDPEKNGRYLVNSSGRWYLNPAYPETVSLICDGISEIVANYKVDGVQIDDYFYPTTSESFDSAAFSASGTSMSLADWRRDNVTKMVRRMYYSVHAANSSAVFGISPQGNTSNNINELYADINVWCSSSGCCDYICPQIYYGFDNEILPYSSTVDEWMRIVTNRDIKLVIGLAAYKTGTEDRYAGAGRREWIESTDVLARQRSVTDFYGIGYAFFRYDSLFVPEPSVSSYASAELGNLR